MVDVLDSTVQMGCGFLVDDDGIGAGLGESLDEVFRRLDHEVGFDGQARQGAQAFKSQRAEGNIGNEAAVHYVDLEPVDARRFNLPNLLTQTSEIRRKYGGRYVDHDSPFVAGLSFLAAASSRNQLTLPSTG